MEDVVERIMKDPERRAKLFYAFTIGLKLTNVMIALGALILIFKLKTG